MQNSVVLRMVLQVTENPLPEKPKSQVFLITDHTCIMLILQLTFKI